LAGCDFFFFIAIGLIKISPVTRLCVCVCVCVCVYVCVQNDSVINLSCQIICGLIQTIQLQ
jgi:hypothetical protein